MEVLSLSYNKTNVEVSNSNEASAEEQLSLMVVAAVHEQIIQMAENVVTRAQNVTPTSSHSGLGSSLGNASGSQIFGGQLYGGSVGSGNPTAGSNSNFDPSLPSDPQDNFMGPGSVMDRLEKLIAYIENNPMDPNAINAIMTFMQNLSAAWGQFSPSQQQMLQQVLNGTPITSRGETLGQVIADAYVASFWFNSGGGQNGINGTYASIQNLLQQLNGMGGANSPFSIIRDMYNQLQGWGTGQCSRTYQFIIAHMNPKDGMPAYQTTYTDANGKVQTIWLDMDYNQFSLIEQGFVGTFIQNSNMHQWIQNFYDVEINSLVQQFKGNAALLVLLIMNVLMGQSDDYNTEIGGTSSVSNGLAGAQNQLNTILNEFKTGNTPGSGTTTGNWTPQAALQFLQALSALKAEIDNNPQLAGLASQIDSAIQSITSISCADTKDFGGMTIGDLYTKYLYDIQNGDTDDANKCMQQIADTLTSIEPSVPNPSDNTPPPSYTTWSNVIQSLNQCVSSVTDQSQAISTQVSYLSNTSQQFLAMIKNFNDGWNSTEKAMVDNQRVS